MPPTDPKSSPTPPESLPPLLLHDLQTLFPTPKIDPIREKHYLNALSAQIRARRHLRTTLRLITASFATALAASLAIVLILRLTPHPPTNQALQLSSPPATLSLPADLNNDGKVDILDALLLAQKIKNHEPLSLRYDLNNDGIVDQKDVQTLLHQIVASPPAKSPEGT